MLFLENIGKVDFEKFGTLSLGFFILHVIIMAEYQEDITVKLGKNILKLISQ